MILQIIFMMPSDSVEQLIRQIPEWTIDYDKEKAAKLLNIAVKLSLLPDQELRRSTEAFVKKVHSTTYELEELSKLYLLFRVLYELPAREERNKVKVFGGWTHPDIDNQGPTFNLSWPVSVNQSLSPTEIEVAKFKGYKGRPYDALGEFDFFVANFSRRKF